MGMLSKADTTDTKNDGSSSADKSVVTLNRAAEMLNIRRDTLVDWQARMHLGVNGQPIFFPEVIKSSKGSLFRADDIQEFGRQLALGMRSHRSEERVRGAYFTPNNATDWMVRWAIRSGNETMLEPSIGDGQFALAAQRNGVDKQNIFACELSTETGSFAISSGAVDESNILFGDFLAENNLPAVDFVAGNPPYVRIRELEPYLRRNAETSYQDIIGNPIDPAGSVWVSFVAKATDCLIKGGRLAFVLPLDFTYVKYARPLWKYLGKSFGRIRIVRFRERVFSDILQNVLILLAEDKGSATNFVEFIAKTRLADISEIDSGDIVRIKIDDIVSDSRPFQQALLPNETLEALRILSQFADKALNRVKFNIGYVSGNKKYFHPNSNDVFSFNLPRKSLFPTVESSRQLSSTGYRTSNIDPSAFLWLPGQYLTSEERKYIEYGEFCGVDTGYKCRIREPWYRVPGVKVPDLILTTFSERPRLIENDSGWYATNSALCGFLARNERPADVIASWYNPLTLLSAELQIHSLGGGVMIAVPNEANSIQLLDTNSTLEFNFGDLDRALKSQDITAAYNVGADSIRALIGNDGVEAILSGAEILLSWRKALK